MSDVPSQPRGRGAFSPRWHRFHESWMCCEVQNWSRKRFSQGSPDVRLGVAHQLVDLLDAAIGRGLFGRRSGAADEAGAQDD